MKIKNKSIKIIDRKIFANIIQLLSFINKSNKRFLIFILFIMVLNSLAELITISALMPLIDIALNPKNISNIGYFNIIFNIFNIQQNYQFFVISFLYIIIIISTTLFKIYALKLINVSSERITKELGEKLYRGIIYKDYSYHLNTNSSLLISSLVQHLDLSVLVFSYFLNIMLSLFCILGILISLTLINFKFVVFTMVIFLLFYFCAGVFTKKPSNFYGKLVFEKRINIIKIVNESLGYIRQIILDDSHETFIEEYNKSNYLYARANKFLSIIGGIPRFLLEFIVLTLFVIILSLMVFNQTNLNIYIPIFGAFLLAIQKLLPFCQKIFISNLQIIQNKDSLYSVVSFLKDSKKSQYNSKIKPSNVYNLKKKITFDNVSFSYKKRVVLQNINYEISRGEVIGIVGKTGVGKSTFIDLLVGLLTPIEGNILIDGKKMDANLFRKFRLSVSYVPQDYFLLDRSIEENIVLGKTQKNIDNKLLKKVLKISMLEDFIGSLKYGLKTNVGEDGVKLSGGQKQRIAIARALYKRHSFLLLDEATSSVDLNTEAKIINNILRNYPDITIIMIAHRLETLKMCDYILEIKEKKLIKHNNIEDYRSNIF